MIDFIIFTGPVIEVTQSVEIHSLYPRHGRAKEALRKMVARFPSSIETQIQTLMNSNLYSFAHVIREDTSNVCTIRETILANDAGRGGDR